MFASANSPFFSFGHCPKAKREQKNSELKCSGGPLTEQKNSELKCSGGTLTEQKSLFLFWALPKSKKRTT
jgi:hypothetical protein